MRAIYYLKAQGFDVEPDINTDLQRELHFTGNEIAYLMESYARQVNGASTSHDKALNLADVNNLAKFCKQISQQEDCPAEFVDIVNKEFWNLI